MGVLNALVLGVLAVVLGGGLYVRLAPSDPARWHGPIAPHLRAVAASQDGVVPLTGRGAAVVRLDGDTGAQLRHLAAVMDGLPRTHRLAGSEAEGRIPWVSRSRLWAFPDYTTAEIGTDGLVVHARLRFGRDDLGVNAARLQGVLAGPGRP